MLGYPFITSCLGMLVSACTVVGALEEMKEASDAIPALEEHTIWNGS